MRSFFALLIGLLMGLDSSAQLADRYFNFTTEQSLPSNSYEAIKQDAFGFIWLASFDGLFRWDGNTVKQYAFGNDTRSGTIIYTIFEDSKQNLWVGGLNGLSRYDRQNDAFVHCSLRGDSTIIPVNAIVEGRDQKLWLGTSYGLCAYDAATASEEWFTTGNDVIFSLAVHRSNTLWVGTINGGIQTFSIASKRFQTLNYPSPKQSTEGFTKINSLLAASDGTVWCGTETLGLLQFDSTGQLLKKYDAFSVSAQGRPNLIRCLYEDKNRTIWIGVVRAPLFYLPLGAASPLPLMTKAENNSQDQPNSVTSVMEDRFGNTWFTSKENGLFSTNQFKNRFNCYGTALGNSPIKDGVSGFLETTGGRRMLATAGSGIYMQHMSSGKISSLAASRTQTDAINDMRMDEGKIWVATWGNGIKLLDSSGTLVEHLRHDPSNINSLPNNDVKAVLATDSVVWIGTHGDGLTLYNKRNRTLTHHLNNTSIPINLKDPAWINHLFLDSRKNIWISTYSGVFVFDGHQLRHYMHNADSTSLGSNAVNMITEDAGGNIWIVHEAGLDRFDTATDRFDRIGMRLGLPGVMKSIVSRGPWIWMSSNDGIVAVHTKTHEVKRWSESDGLAANMYQRTVFASEDGSILVGGSKGFIRFNPDELGPVSTPLLFYFTELISYGEDGTRTQRIHQSAVELDASQHFFSINFTTPDFYAPGELRFRYRLNKEQKWIDLGDQRRLLFTNLQAGSYTLFMQVLSGVGTWRDAPTTLQITILPPWWKTWWFRLLLVISAALGAFAFFRWRTRTIQLRNQQLKQEVARQTAELTDKNESLLEQRDQILLQHEKIEASNEELIRQTNRILEQQQEIVNQNTALSTTVEKLKDIDQVKTRFYSLLAHDLRNPILAQAELTAFLKENSRSIDRKQLELHLDTLQTSSNGVHELLINLLNWARTESPQLLPNPAYWNLKSMVTSNLMLLRSQFSNKSITTAINLQESFEIFADRNMADAALRNVLSNAAKFTPVNGMVRISATQQPEHLELIIEDNGVGMDANQLKQLFALQQGISSLGTEGERGLGLGLLVARAFMEANGGQVKLYSEKGKGTRVTLIFPIATSAFGSHNESPTLPISATTEWEINEEDRIRIKGKKVLLVDDNAEIRAYLKLVLSGLFETFEAINGKDALDKIHQTQPDLIITDILMPGIDGLQFCREVKGNPATSHIPVIVLTGQLNSDYTEKSLGAGADVYLEKPIKNQVLIKLMANLLIRLEKQRQLLVEQVMNEYPLAMTSSGLNPSDDQFIRNLVAAIENRLSDTELDAQVLAKQLGVSRSVLYGKVKTLTGHTVHEFIKLVRLRKSVKLLMDGNLSITQIAFEVGFNSRSYFDRCFARQFKMAPREYVNAHR